MLPPPHKRSQKLRSTAPKMASLSSPITLLLIIIYLNIALSFPTSSAIQSQKQELAGRRNLVEEEDPPLKSPPKKKTTTLDTKSQTKPLKPKKSNSTTSISNKTSTSTGASTTKIKLNKLNKTLNAIPKPSNSTKLPKSIKPLKSNSTKTQFKALNSTSNSLKSQKKTLDLPPSPKNKTTLNPKPKTQPQPTKLTTADKPSVDKKKKQSPPLARKLDQSNPWLDSDDNDGVDDLIAEFRGLPSRLLPDLERLSTTSKAYISIANREIAKGVKPYVGHKYAPTIASIASGVFLVLPLLLLTLIFHHLRSYLSIQRVVIFIQAYLAIYFATLAVTALVTGLEPLRFFYAASPSSYAFTQALQTLGYVLYLLVQLVHLVVVFSSAGEGGGGARALGLAQMVVGLAVGLHYYAMVFHRAVASEPPRANWKVHAVYAVCFVVICACARAERRKKAYIAEGGDDGKKS